jgi:carboxypeptidase T
MVKTKTLFIILLLLLLFLFFAGQSKGSPKLPDQARDTLISMKISEYQQYLTTNPPLDRLYRLGDTLYFLKNTCKSQQRTNSKSLTEQQRGDLNGIYHNYLETESRLHELAAQYPELAVLFSIGQSIEGRELYVMKISDQPGTDQSADEPNVYIVGCHHAREWISVEIPLYFIRHLLENYHSNQGVRRAVDGAQIFIQPIQNPDGLEFSIHTYRYWRKNRRYNGDFSWGVDPNRNYGYQWGYDDIGSSPDPDSGIYRGTAPFSEPECAAVRDFLLEHPPSGSLSFHNYSQAILYPWSYNRQPTADNEELYNLAREMSDRIFQVNGRLYTYGLDPLGYPANGGTSDWIYGIFRTPSFTIELPPEYSVLGGFFTSEEMIQSAFRENLPAMLYFINYFIPEN